MNDFLSGYKKYDPEREGYGSPFDWKKEFFRRMSPEEARDILCEEDPYAILRLKRGASLLEMKKAYRKQAMKWHPDKNIGKIKLATEMMKKINAAYSLLT